MHYTEQYIYGWCSKGKLRAKGKRLAFFWVVPRPSWLGEKPFQLLIDLNERMGKPNFFIPARRARTRTHHLHWVPSPMGHSMCARVVAAALERAGMPKEVHRHACYGT